MASKIPVTVEGPEFVITAKKIGTPDVYTGTVFFDFRGISPYALQSQPEIWQLVLDALASYLEAIPKEGAPIAVVPSILVEEPSMQLVFVLDLDFLTTLKNLFLKDWQKISRIVSAAPENSTLKGYKTLFVHVTENPNVWKYLVSDESYSGASIQSAFDFVFLFATKERACVGSVVIGYELLHAKLWEEAAIEFERVINNTSHNNLFANAVENFASARQQAGKHLQAIEYLKKLITSGRADATTHYALGYLYHDLGESQKAIDELHKAIQMNPTFYYAHYNLVCDLALLGDFNKALRAIDNAHKLGLMIARELKDDPDCAQLAQDPRFQRRLR